MSTSKVGESLPENVIADGTHVKVTFTDGSYLSFPAADYERLANATVAERNDWMWLGSRTGIHWPKIDEDLSISGLRRDYPIHPAVSSLADVA